MARKRDYKAEYARRIRKGLKRGLSRSQARGHARGKESPLRRKVSEDKALDRALRALANGKTQKAAAKSAQVSVERLRRHIYSKELAHREGRKWVMTDLRPRRVPVLHKGRQKTIVVRGFAEASRAGRYHNDIGRFVRSNDIGLLKPYRGKGLTDLKGHFYEFETDPNAIHRYASIDTPAFHEIYQIVSD